MGEVGEFNEKPRMPVALATIVVHWRGLGLWTAMLLCMAGLVIYGIRRAQRIGRIAPALRKVELATLPIATMAAAPLIMGIGEQTIGHWATLGIMVAVWGGALVVAVVMRRRIFARVRAASKLVCDSCLYPQLPNVGTEGGRCSECRRSWKVGELAKRWQDAAEFYHTTFK